MTPLTTPWNFRLAWRFFVCAFFLIVSAQEVAAQPYGDITIDGTLGDWTKVDRLDLPPYRAPADTELYGDYAQDHFLFAVRSPAIQANSRVTIWINSDRNADTGFQIFGSTGGAEYHAIAVFGSPALLIAGQPGGATTASLNTAYTVGALEVAIPKSLLGTDGNGIQILVDVDGQVFIPADFSLTQYFQPELRRPRRVASSKRVAIVYSESTAKRFFDLKAYSQLFMSAQHQAMMAGIPFDLLSESDLTDIANLVNYDAIVFPYMQYVPLALRRSIEESIISASYRYGIGLIVVGDFVTNDDAGTALPGDPYFLTKAALGVMTTAGGGPNDLELRATTNTHPVTRGYDLTTPIMSYKGLFYRVFDFFGGTSGTVLATQTVTEASGQVTTFPAVLTTLTGGYNVFFTTLQYMGDTNLLWSALRWTVYQDGLQVGLQMGREQNIFFARNDMDQSQYVDDFVPVYGALEPLLNSWRGTYDFVGSYYLNIGNKPNEGEYTNWSVSGPFYQRLIAAGNELGNHSYTHPQDTNLLTSSEIAFEFGASRAELEKQLGRKIPGAAIPGAPDKLSTALEILKHADYLSGGYAGVGAGFPGAFGFLTPTSNKIYFSPNMTFDFALIQFRKLTAAQAEAFWLAEYDTITRNASQPIVHWPWHDYGPTVGLPDGYTVAMYEALLKHARNKGSEFVTGDDLAQRISSFVASSMTLGGNSETFTASVDGSGLGNFSLGLSNTSEKVIRRVANWYAYSTDRVFLPNSGGAFEVTLGTTQDDVTRIVKLPMRAKLVAATGDGRSIDFSLQGSGLVTVALKNDPLVHGYQFTGENASQTGQTVTFNFTSATLNQAKVSALFCGDGAVTSGKEGCDDGNTANGDGCSASCQVESGYRCGGAPSLCVASCGDAVVSDGEQCDDGNATSGDGCSTVCTLEPGYSCTGVPSVCAKATTLAVFGSIAAEDGWLRMTASTGRDGSFSATTTGSSALRVGDDKSNKTYRSILSFDTSSLPDNATIQSVTLEITRGSLTGSDPSLTLGQVQAAITRGFFGSTAKLGVDDFSSSATVPLAGSLSGIGTERSLIRLPLNAAAAMAVNQTGRTQVRLAFPIATNGNRADNYVSYFSAEASLVRERPRLIVEYTLP